MAETCQTCHLVHAPADVPVDANIGEALLHEARACIAAQKTAMRVLLQHAGKKDTCRGSNCRAPLFKVVHLNGKETPYTEAGLNHFVDCPDRKQFARKP